MLKINNIIVLVVLAAVAFVHAATPPKYPVEPTGTGIYRDKSGTKAPGILRGNEKSPGKTEGLFTATGHLAERGRFDQRQFHNSSSFANLRYKGQEELELRASSGFRHSPADSGFTLPELGQKWANFPEFRIVFPEGPMPSDSVPTALYVRYSTKQQKSISTQVADCLKKAKGMAESRLFVDANLVFADGGKSGKIMNRPGYQAMLEAAAAGRFKCLIFFHSNRLARRREESLRTMKKLVSQGVRVISVTQDWDSGNSAKWNKGVQILQSAIDELGAGSQTDAIRSAQKELFEQRFLIKRPPFGYCGEVIPGKFTKCNLPLRKAVVDPVAVKVVEWIFQTGARGVSDAETTRQLLRDNVPPPPGCQSWSANTICRIRTNRHYLGEWVYGESENEFDDDKDRSVRTLRPEALCRKTFLELQIITTELFDRVQEVRTRDSRRYNAGAPLRKTARRDRPNLLNGMLICPEHGRKLVATGTTYGHYFCLKCKHSPEQTLYTRLNAPRATRRLSQAVSKFLLEDPRLIQRVVDRCSELNEGAGKADPAELRRLDAEKDRLTTRIRELRVNMELAEDDLRRDDQIAVIAELERRRTEAASRLRQLQAVETGKCEMPTPEAVEARARELAEVLERGVTTDDAQAIADAREVLRLITGGKITLRQHGEHRTGAGWLTGHFDADPLGILLSKYGACSATGTPKTPVEVNFKELSLPEEIADEVTTRFDAGMSLMEIAVVMEVDRSTATKAMKIGFARRGEVPPTRSELCSRGGKKSPKGQADRDRELAGLAGPLYVAGQTGKEVARALSIDPATARNAIRNWYILSNLPMPNFRSDANNRRQASKASAVTSAA